MRQHKKHLDFELNLVPFIDLLSVCIFFVLITAVWLNVGSMNVKQAVGGQSAAETEKKPLLMVTLDPNGTIALSVKDSGRVPGGLRNIKLSAQAGKLDVDSLSKVLDQIRKSEPGLRTALIQPKAQTLYEDIVGLMDQFRKSGVVDLGIMPL